MLPVAKSPFLAAETQNTKVVENIDGKLAKKVHNCRKSLKILVLSRVFLQPCIMYPIYLSLPDGLFDSFSYILVDC